MSLSKISPLLYFLTSNYNRKIEIAEIEAVSNYSYRNAQRVFKLIFCETIGSFTQRQKVEVGYKKLIFTKETISSIAFEVGFQNLQAFSKAFKIHFGISPSYARNRKDNLILSHAHSTENLKPIIQSELVFMDKIEVWTKKIKVFDYNNTQIEALWSAIDAEIPAKEQNYFGIINEEPLFSKNKMVTYTAAVDTNPQKANFFKYSIFGRKYLKYIHLGSYETINDTYRYIYQECLLQNKRQIDSSPFIEKYIDFGQNELTFQTEIYVPIK